MTDETMRAEFERWARANDITIDYDKHGFDPYEWAAWQAAIDTERARCAEIARSMGENEGPDYRRACDDIAGAIEDE